MTVTRGRPLSQGVPSSKQSTGLFLEFPTAEGFLRLVSLASQATRELCPMDPAAFEKAGETFLLWTSTDSGNNAGNSGAEEQFIQLFCDAFGAEKGQYLP